VKEDFIDLMRFERRAVLATLDGVDDVTLATLPICGDWTAKDILAHLASVDAAILGVVRQVRAGEPVTWAWEGHPQGYDWNAVEVASRQNLTVAEVRAELEENHRDLIAELESWPADSGPFDPDSWDEEKSPFGWAPSHEREHAEYLRALQAGHEFLEDLDREAASTSRSRF